MKKKYFEPLNDEKRQKLVTDNINLVYFIANKYSSEDVVQEGFLGLLYAASNFDFSSEYQFSTYAVACIKGSIHRYMTNDNKFKITGEAASAKSEYIKLLNQGSFKGKSPSEIANLLGVKETVVVELECLYNIINIDKTINNCNIPFYETIADSSSLNFCEKVDNKITVIEIFEKSLELFCEKHCYKTNKERNAIIIRRYYYGIMGFAKAETFNSIGKDYDITRECVRQIISRFNDVFEMIYEKEMLN